ncbi:MAG: DAK2 domain-containing protein [Oscillospiraceae bacterium]|nr:DAK2 domain-containing protein [Oscillospiraceae bacterium]
MINGSILREAFISASNSIYNSKKAVDELNVFPVPDGDTGTNMSMTLSNAKKELMLLDETADAYQVAKAMSSALLRGARGNSGVITSLLFKGFEKALKGKQVAEVCDIANALQLGVEGAYKNVMKPTEGTILTVARLAAEKGNELAKKETDVATFWNQVTEEAERVLATTPDLLPTLKKAGVVDAGGKGLCIMMQAMGQVFMGNGIVEVVGEKAQEPVTVETFSSVVGEFDDEITFTYCTEYIVNKNEGCPDAIKLRAYLETIGDCVVVVEDDEIIKVHVHTNNPGLAIEKALEFGSMTLPKVENMRYQHKEKKKEGSKKANVSGAGKAYTPVKPEKKYGFVAVAAGDGVEEMFKDAGADCIVKGGQTMNPSTEDILAAIEACPAEIVFVLPNNKNIIMAAEQAAPLADRKVCVLQTRTIPQGLTALLNFDPTADFNANRSGMTTAFERVQTGQVTFAARDSEFDGHTIKKGQYLALENGKMSLVEEDLEKAAYRLTKRLVKSDSEFITIIYGADVTDGAAESLRARVEAKFGNRFDISLLAGGQPVYYYIISVE